MCVCCVCAFVLSVLELSARPVRFSLLSATDSQASKQARSLTVLIFIGLQRLRERGLV